MFQTVFQIHEIDPVFDTLPMIQAFHPALQIRASLGTCVRSIRSGNGVNSFQRSCGVGQEQGLTARLESI